MGFWPYFLHAHESDGGYDDDPSSPLFLFDPQSPPCCLWSSRPMIGNDITLFCIPFLPIVVIIIRNTNSHTPFCIKTCLLYTSSWGREPRENLGHSPAQSRSSPPLDHVGMTWCTNLAPCGGGGGGGGVVVLTGREIEAELCLEKIEGRGERIRMWCCYKRDWKPVLF